MSAWELAQLNIAEMRGPMESPAMADFVANLDRINATAEGPNGFVYRSAHAPIMRRRGEWFEGLRQAHMVLWWVPAGHRPSEADAFTFQHPFPMPTPAAQP